METETPKPQTGGLKLMTVFIVVLLLHVAVIGGISAYHLLKGNTGDALANNTPAVQTTETPEVKDPLLEGYTPTPVEDTTVTTNTPAPVMAEDTFVNTPNQPQGEHIIDQNTSPAVVASAAKIAGPESAPIVEKSTGEYVVVKGDTLSRIARTHGMKVAELRSLNGLSHDNLKIGQKLKVNGGGTTVAAVIHESSSVAVEKKAGTPVPTVHKSTYTVSKGDTLVKIARRFSTTPAALMAANKISDPTKLKIGASLVIPGAVKRNELSEQKDGAQPFKPVKPDHGDLVMAQP